MESLEATRTVAGCQLPGNDPASESGYYPKGAKKKINLCCVGMHQTARVPLRYEQSKPGATREWARVAPASRHAAVGRPRNGTPMACKNPELKRSSDPEKAATPLPIKDESPQWAGLKK
jgi:hypothetical protein